MPLASPEILAFLDGPSPRRSAGLLSRMLSDDPHSYDLLPSSDSPLSNSKLSLEDKLDIIFGPRHLRLLLNNPSYLSLFASFIKSQRPTESIHLLIFYLDTKKALRAIAYANAISSELDYIEGLAGLDRSETGPPRIKTVNHELERKAGVAFKELMEQELPAFITSRFIEVVTHNVKKRITGTLKQQLVDAVDGLGECFCLTDPSRKDNPIVFMSEAFNRTTQYGVDYVIGRNCRFLQGPRTDSHVTKRIREACEKGEQVSEVFLNYRRDGSPFANLLLVAPLFDSKGVLKYFIGAQVDVTVLVNDGIGLDSLKELGLEGLEDEEEEKVEGGGTQKDEFRALAELLNDEEMETAKAFGGKLHKGSMDESLLSKSAQVMKRPRLIVNDGSSCSCTSGDDSAGGEEEEEEEDYWWVGGTQPPEEKPTASEPAPANVPKGLLNSVYQNYLLVRPYPSLRILFTSPSLRTPGIHQLPLMEKIGGSRSTIEKLTAALEQGRGVTAKVTWITRRNTNPERPEVGRDRWIHCTPMLDKDGIVGVWMVVIVDAVPKKQKQHRMISMYRKTKTPILPQFDFGMDYHGAVTEKNSDDVRFHDHQDDQGHQADDEQNAVVAIPKHDTSFPGKTTLSDRSSHATPTSIQDQIAQKRYLESTANRPSARPSMLPLPTVVPPSPPPTASTTATAPSPASPKPSVPVPVAASSPLPKSMLPRSSSVRPGSLSRPGTASSTRTFGHNKKDSKIRLNIHVPFNSMFGYSLT